jgi:putative effector of murein hydrolase
MFRYTVIAFAILLAFLIIRDVNYEKWYGEEETTTELVEPTSTIDTLNSE